MNTSKFKKVYWRVNTHQLFREIINNNEGLAIIEQPLQILLRKLGVIAEIASKQQNEEIMKICCELALYEECDEYNEKFDQEMVEYFRNFGGK